MRCLSCAWICALAISVPARAAGVFVDGPFLRDSFGRVVFFHGVNAVWKHPPYVPPSSIYPEGTAGWVSPEESLFDERDAQFLADNGLDSVRLGCLWAGAEPTKDVFDEAYLDRIEEIVDLLARSGVTVLLDFHQDMYNEKYQGEGFPDWAAIDDGVPPQRPTFGFPANYFTPPVLRAFDNLWMNRGVDPGSPLVGPAPGEGLRDRARRFWKHVAERFRGRPNLLGYDLLNEPWPGSQWESCANPAGCPAFDALSLQPFFEELAAGIREVDPESIVWWEPNVTNDFGAANGVGVLRPIAAGPNGISFHDYCLVGGLTPVLSRGSDPECARAEEVVFQQQALAAARNGSALFLTEFGASDDLADIARVAGLADRYMVSWHYWHYGSWSDPTGNPAEEGLFTDDRRRFESPDSLKRKADLLIRTYPKAIAGTPLSFSFDPDTREFRLAYEADPRIDAPTVIFVPVTRHYPRGYELVVEGPARVISGPDEKRLQLANEGGGVVTVRLTPR